MQRFFDLFFSVLALIFLFPVLVFVAVILRVTGEGEVFFCKNELENMEKSLIY